MVLACQRGYNNGDRSIDLALLVTTHESGTLPTAWVSSDLLKISFTPGESRQLTTVSTFTTQHVHDNCQFIFTSPAPHSGYCRLPARQAFTLLQQLQSGVTPSVAALPAPSRSFFLTTFFLKDFSLAPHSGQFKLLYACRS